VFTLHRLTSLFMRPYAAKQQVWSGLSDPLRLTCLCAPSKPASFFQEQPPQVMEVAPQLSRHWTRRDLLLFGLGAITTVGAGGALLPQTTLKRLGIIHENKDWPRREWLLNKSLRIDDDVQKLCIHPIAWCPQHQKADYPAQEQLQRSYS